MLLYLYCIPYFLLTYYLMFTIFTNHHTNLQDSSFKVVTSIENVQVSYMTILRRVMLVE